MEIEKFKSVKEMDKEQKKKNSSMIIKIISHLI